MMRDDKLIELFKMYVSRAGPWLNRLESDLYDVPVSQYVTMTDRKKQVGHAAWMAAEAIGWIEEAQRLEASAPKLLIKDSHSYVRDMPIAARSKREKAHRWLGFIQGVLWMAGAFTLNELKEHSHKCSDDYEETKR